MNSSRTNTQLKILEGERRQSAPFLEFEYVTVTFSTANQDYAITTTLRPSNPEDIDYEVVRKDRAADIYHDASGTRRAWQAGQLVLRSSTANAVVDLRLSIRRTP